MTDIFNIIAAELKAEPQQVQAAVSLLDSGSTVPFIARYRKEATQGLDDIQLRHLETRLSYLRELNERRDSIIKSIQEQGKMVPELLDALSCADTKARLEDLYLPYKPKRRTKSQIAREAGLAPLAEALLLDLTADPELLAKQYLNPDKEITTERQALEGARFILMDDFSLNADLLQMLRQDYQLKALLKSSPVAEHLDKTHKFSDYADFEQRLQDIPSHRFLALLRGRKEGFLQLSLQTPPSEAGCPFEQKIASFFKLNLQDTARGRFLAETVKWTWRIKLQTQLELELLNAARETAEAQAIDVFAQNLRDLLMSSPAGPKVCLGLDPGLRTGVKWAVVDGTGKVLNTGAFFPHAPRNEWDKSQQVLQYICSQYQVALISIGNGTASRETDLLVGEFLKKNPQLSIDKVIVSEAGASVYSASKLASEEFPDLDVSLRGAVSIARRLQDPLAELVKIDPKSIGVGQYQHDVNAHALARSLDSVVEDCVNAVGVDVNTASTALLGRVAGLNSQLAANIVAFRNQFGAFNSRQALKSVPRLGPKAFEQAAGFLRILKGENPLDASGVHPESYPVVQKILLQLAKPLDSVLGNSQVLSQVPLEKITDHEIGLPTVQDIIKELEKPGRDPRPEFKTARFSRDVLNFEDVKVGMILEGVITNVANFGAFVDIGVHQDGLVHISELADRFVSNPRDVVKTNDLVTVRVLSIDSQRRRIALSLKLHNTHNAPQESKAPSSKSSQPATKARPKTPQASAFGAALLDALKQTTT